MSVKKQEVSRQLSANSSTLDFGLYEYNHRVPLPKTDLVKKTLSYNSKWKNLKILSDLKSKEGRKLSLSKGWYQKRPKTVQKSLYKAVQNRSLYIPPNENKRAAFLLELRLRMANCNESVPKQNIKRQKTISLVSSHKKLLK